MRQAGIIAAAGVMALQPGPDGMIDRLAEDHATARRLAEGPLPLRSQSLFLPHGAACSLVQGSFAGHRGGFSRPERLHFLGESVLGLLDLRGP